MAKNVQTQKQNIGDKLCRPTPWFFKRCYQLWRGTAAAYLFVFLFHLLIADGDRRSPSLLPPFPLLSCTISWVAAMQLYEELLLDCKRWKDPSQTCFLLPVSAFIHRLLDVRFVRQRTWSERGSHQFQWMNNEWSLFKFSFDMEWYRPAWHSNMRKQSCFGCTIWFMTAVTKWVGHKYVIKQSLVSAVNFDWFFNESPSWH